MIKITILGSGNIAHHLAEAFTKAGHTIDAIYSRNTSNAQALASTLPNCTVLENLDCRNSKSELFLLAISDNALEEVIAKLQLPPNAILAHTSGSMPMAILAKHHNHGVFYLLQTFTKGKAVDLYNTPIGIEASNAYTMQFLTILATGISQKVQALNSEERKTIHVAAVFACNFTNHFLSIAENLLKEKNIPFSVMEPLINETVRKAFSIGPQQAQTGPAKRGDLKIINQHLDYLRNEPELYQLYELISSQIRKAQAEKDVNE